MPTFMGGSGKRSIRLGKRQEARLIEAAQNEPKEREASREMFSSDSAHSRFLNSRAKLGDLGEPSGKNGKWTVADVRAVETEFELRS